MNILRPLMDTPLTDLQRVTNTNYCLIKMNTIFPSFLFFYTLSIFVPGRRIDKKRNDNNDAVRRVAKPDTNYTK